MFICFLIVVIGHGVQGTPNGYVSVAEATLKTPHTPLTWTVWAPEGTTFIQGTNAILNILYTFIGHALIPSFVGDMKRPQDFPKALYLSMAVSRSPLSWVGRRTEL
jgi:amino acid transporter